jgi:Fur family transcriptional regulator, stress-responsive regulator
MSEHLECMLRGASLRVTRPWAAVPAAVHAHPHADPDRSCRAIADVDRAVGEVPCLTTSDAQGYSIDEAEVVYGGRCPACAAASETTAQA